MHTVPAARRRGKSVAGQLTKGSYERAAQVILGVSVTTGKAWAAATQQLRDSRYGCSLSQQLLSDPLVGNTPIGVWESLWNPQPLQPGLVDVGAAEKVPDAGTTNSQASGPGSDPVAAVPVLGRHRICRSAACTSTAPWVAKPSCACKSRTHGAYPLFWRRRGFWLVNPANRPR
jgi:hypothetical protein